MPSIPRVLRAYGRDAAGAFRLAPVEIVLGVGVAVAFSVWSRQSGDPGWWWRVSASAALAFLLLFATSVLRARGVIGDGLRWGISAAMLLGAAAYGAWLFDPGWNTETWRWLALFGAAGLALTLVPVAGADDSAVRRDRYWRFNFLLAARLLTVLAYGLALWAALSGAVAAVSSLFELKTPRNLYEDIFGWIFFALVPWVLVGGIGELVARERSDEAAPRSLRLLGRYLYVPVLAVYLAILLAYVGKVAVTGEFPNNVLSPIVLVAGLGGLLGSLLLEPLRRDPEHSGVARLVRVLPLLLLPLLPFALWAVWVRTDQHGWTEPRYLRMLLLVVLTGVCLAGAVRFFRGREPLLLTVPLVLGVALLLGAVGPWSASAVSRRSQQTRLLEGMREAGLLAGGRVRGLRPPEPVDTAGTVPMAPQVEVAPVRGPRPRPERPGTLVSRELYERVRGGVTYLYDTHGPESLEGIFGRDLRGYEGGWTLADALPIYQGCDVRRPDYLSATLPEDVPVRVPAGVLYRMAAAGRNVSVPPPAGPGMLMGMEVSGSGLVARFGGTAPWTGRVDLRPLLARARAVRWQECDASGGQPGIQLTADEARFPLVGPDGRRRGELILTQAGLSLQGGRDGGAPVLQHASGLLVVTE